MKKAIGVLSVLLLVFLMVSCGTTQADIDNQFRGVYDKYQGDIILDGAQTYTVAQGDTLSKIANHRYGAGHGYFFPLIMLASKDVVLDPDLIEPGMQLTIPDLQANLDNPTARSKIKLFLLDIAGIYEKKGDDPRSVRLKEELTKLSNTL